MCNINFSISVPDIPDKECTLNPSERCVRKVTQDNTYSINLIWGPERTAQAIPFRQIWQGLKDKTHWRTQ